MSRDKSEQKRQAHVQTSDLCPLTVKTTVVIYFGACLMFTKNTTKDVTLIGDQNEIDTFTSQNMKLHLNNKVNNFF